MKKQNKKVKPKEEIITITLNKNHCGLFVDFFGNQIENVKDNETLGTNR